MPLAEDFIVSLERSAGVRVMRAPSLADFMVRVELSARRVGLLRPRESA